MHDPMTVAFDIKRPWPTFRKQPFAGSRWYWPTLITIWHVDPESNGTDDSCGWSRPHLTKRQAGHMDFLGGCEARDPWLLEDRSKQPLNAAAAEAKLRGAIMQAAWAVGKPVTFSEASEWASRLLHNGDNVRSGLCHLPGWHTNFPDDREDDRRERATSLFSILGRYVLRERRRWYQHPRWHVRHWKVQFHPLQNFKRWAFSRCAGCGGRFTYGYAPVTFQWHSDGPRWFRSETGKYHDACSTKANGAAKPQEVSAN